MKKNISAKSMAQRSKQNAITLVGQFSIFIVETLASLLVQMLVIYHDKVEWIDNSVLLPTVILATAIIAVTSIMASPEIRKFYFS